MVCRLWLRLWDWIYASTDTTYSNRIRGGCYSISCIKLHKLMLKYKGFIFIFKIALLFSDCRFIVGMHRIFGHQKLSAKNRVFGRHCVVWHSAQIMHDRKCICIMLLLLFAVALQCCNMLYWKNDSSTDLLPTVLCLHALMIIAL